MPYPEQDDYFNVEDFQDMMVSVDDLMKKLSDSGAQISSDAEHLYNQTKAQMDNIQKRMNAFTALKEGSTTGDAELTDIRVAYDGKEYGNAGEAVREQASDIHKALFGAGASIWSKAKSESTKYVAETKGICILNERFTAAGVVTKISRGTFAENESTLNLDRECSAYIVEFEKNPGTVYMPSAETIKIVSTTKIIFEANGNARCWIPVEKGQYLAVDSTATAYTSESNHVPYMLYDQANKTLECRGFGSAGSIEPVAPYSLALEYKLEYDMDDTGLVKQIDANREAAASLKEEKINKPSTTDNNKIPRAKDGEIEWVEVGQPTDEQANSAVSNWLNEHPEATTTVQDESITEVKLTKELKLLLVNGYINAKYTGLSEKNDGERNKIAIEKAIEYAISNKVSVFIPSGVYTVDGGISLKSLYALRIFGNGLANSENNSTIIKNDTYTSLFVIDGCNSCSICNLRIRSANAPAIELCNSRSHKNTFKNIDIDNVQTDGIKIASPTGYTYFENVVISLNNKSAVAIDIDGTGVSENDVKPNYIYFKKCAIDSISTGDIPSCNGINLKNCYYIFFDSCDFAHLQNAVCLLENSSYINFNASVFFQCENAFNRMKKNVTYDYGIISNCIFKCLNYAFFIQSDSEYDQLYRYWTVSCTYVNTGIGMFNNSYNDIFEISCCMFEPKNPDLHGKTNRRNCLSLNRYYVKFESLETKDFSISIENECVKSFGALSINSKIVVNSVSVSGNKAIVSLTNTVNSKQATYVTLI